MSLVRFPVSSRSSLLGISSALLPANLVHSHLTRKQSIFKAKNIFPRGKQRPTVCLSKRAGESDEVDNSYQLQSRINNTETDYDAPGFEDGSRDCEDWLGVDALGKLCWQLHSRLAWACQVVRPSMENRYSLTHAHWQNAPPSTPERLWWLMQTQSMNTMTMSLMYTARTNKMSAQEELPLQAKHPKQGLLGQGQTLCLTNIPMGGPTSSQTFSRRQQL